MDNYYNILYLLDLIINHSSLLGIEHGFKFNTLFEVNLIILYILLFIDIKSD